MKVRLLKCKEGHKTVAIASYNPKLCEADIDFFVDSNGRMTRHKRCGSKLILNRIVETGISNSCRSSKAISQNR